MTWIIAAICFPTSSTGNRQPSVIADKETCIQRSVDFVKEKGKGWYFLSTMKSKIYPAKIDWWLWLILIGCSLGLIV
ncbi:MAG: hypothetical protein P1V20_06055 [Verrucomicrobiales bacterium]|nr:hypothetical protein [Verrucomicrobiales bacterium]